jgi:hypothetical protein
MKTIIKILLVCGVLTTVALFWMAASKPDPLPAWPEPPVCTSK